MKEPSNLIEYRERRIKGGKNARLYGSIFYISVMTILLIVENAELFPAVLYLVFIYFIMVGIMTLRLSYEQAKLSRLLEKQKKDDF